MFRLGLLIVIALVAVFAAFDIVGGRNLKDAVVGHVVDIKDRVTHTDESASGITYAANEFRKDDVGRDPVHWANGTAGLVIGADTTYIQLGNSFETGPAPDLYIYVATQKVVDEDSFWAADPIEVSKLKSGSGAQFYELPAEITDLGHVEVIIWCKRFGAFIGAVTLEA